MGWNAANCTGILADGEDGLLVNLVAAVGTDGLDGLGYRENSQWTPRPALKDLIMVTGNLCLNEVRIPVKSRDVSL